MPKSFANQFDLPCAWPHTTLGVWHKYPNAHAPHVVSMDVVDCTYDVETDKVRIERIMGVQQDAPYWVMKLLGGSDRTYVREVTMIDRSEQSFIMTSTNLNLSQYLLVKEYITYRPSPRDEANATTFTQRALIECTGLSGGVLDRAAKKVEQLSFQRFGDNAERGRQGILSVLQHMWGNVVQ